MKDKLKNEMTYMLIDHAVKTGGHIITPTSMKKEHDMGGIGRNATELFGYIANRQDLFGHKRSDGYVFITDTQILNDIGMKKWTSNQAKNDLLHYNLIFIKRGCDSKNKVVLYYKINIEGFYLHTSLREEVYNEYKGEREKPSWSTLFPDEKPPPYNVAAPINFTETEWEMKKFKARRKVRVVGKAKPEVGKPEMKLISRKTRMAK